MGDDLGVYTAAQTCLLHRRLYSDFGFAEYANEPLLHLVWRNTDHSMHHVLYPSLLPGLKVVQDVGIGGFCTVNIPRYLAPEAHLQQQ